MSKEYWYEMVARPISPGSQPKGFKEFNETKGRWGIVKYDRKLTKQQLDNYEMREWKEQ